MEHFSPHTGGKEWCDQCESRKEAAAVRTCQSRFCKLKPLLQFEVGFTPEPPIAPPVIIPAKIAASVERARAMLAPLKKALKPKEKIMQAPAPKISRMRDNDGLTPKTRMLLIEMRKRAAPDGTVTISYSDVYKAINCASAPTISPLMQSLIERGFVTILERKGGKEKTRYLVNGIIQEHPAFVPSGEPVEQLAIEISADPQATVSAILDVGWQAASAHEPEIDEIQITMAETCESCRFAKCLTIGRIICRRLPPHSWHGYPCVKADDWCGEFEESA